MCNQNLHTNTSSSDHSTCNTRTLSFFRANDRQVWKNAFYIAGIALALQLVRLVYSRSNGETANLSRVVSASSVCNVYVPGAGFSGFFFMLGRLQTLPSSSQNNYYCFSAGCLGVVATLISNYTVEEVTDIAFQVQKQWSNGELTRYDLTDAFVNKLLPPHHDESISSSELLSKVNIITTVSSSASVLSQHVRTATTVRELREMLVQTTWIPFLTGWGLSKNGHYDGAFAQYLGGYQSTYDVSLDLPLMWADLMLNQMNPKLSINQTQKYYYAGASYKENANMC